MIRWPDKIWGKKLVALLVPFGEAALSSSRRLTLCFALVVTIAVTSVPCWALAPGTRFNGSAELAINKSRFVALLIEAGVPLANAGKITEDEARQVLEIISGDESNSQKINKVLAILSKRSIGRKQVVDLVRLSKQGIPDAPPLWVFTATPAAAKGDQAQLDELVAELRAPRTQGDKKAALAKGRLLREGLADGIERLEERLGLKDPRNYFTVEFKGKAFEIHPYFTSIAPHRKAYPLPEGIKELAALLTRYNAAIPDEALFVHFRGRAGSGKSSIAQALAQSGIGPFRADEIENISLDQIFGEALSEGESVFVRVRHGMSMAIAKGKRLFLLEGAVDPQHLISAGGPFQKVHVKVFMEKEERVSWDDMKERAEADPRGWHGLASLMGMLQCAREMDLISRYDTIDPHRETADLIIDTTGWREASAPAPASEGIGLKFQMEQMSPAEARRNFEEMQRLKRSGELDKIRPQKTRERKKLSDLVVEEADVLEVKHEYVGIARASGGIQYLDSSGISSCITVSLYDNKTKTGAMLHFRTQVYDVADNFNRAYAYLRDIGVNGNDLEARIIGGDNQSDNSKYLFYKVHKFLCDTLGEEKIVEIDVFSERLEVAFLDLTDGELYDSDMPEALRQMDAIRALSGVAPQPKSAFDEIYRVRMFDAPPEVVPEVMHVPHPAYFDKKRHMRLCAFYRSLIGAAMRGDTSSLMTPFDDPQDGERISEILEEEQQFAFNEFCSQMNFFRSHPRDFGVYERAMKQILGESEYISCTDLVNRALNRGDTQAMIEQFPKLQDFVLLSLFVIHRLRDHERLWLTAEEFRKSQSRWGGEGGDVKVLPFMPNVFEILCRYHFDELEKESTDPILSRFRSLHAGKRPAGAGWFDSSAEWARIAGIFEKAGIKPNLVATDTFKGWAKDRRTWFPGGIGYIEPQSEGVKKNAMRNNQVLISDEGAVISGIAKTPFMIFSELIDAEDIKVLHRRLAAPVGGAIAADSRLKSVRFYNLPGGFTTMAFQGEVERMEGGHLDPVAGYIPAEFTMEGRNLLLIDPVYYEGIKAHPEFTRFLKEQGLDPQRDIRLVDESEAHRLPTNFRIFEGKIIANYTPRTFARCSLKEGVVVMPDSEDKAIEGLPFYGGGVACSVGFVVAERDGKAESSGLLQPLKPRGIVPSKEMISDMLPGATPADVKSDIYQNVRAHEGGFASADELEAFVRRTFDNRRAIASAMLAPGTKFAQEKASISEIKGWTSDKIISSECELVTRFGHKGWGLILAQALSREMGTFKVPEFEIIEIGELWEPFYKANKEAIDKIIRINCLMKAFRETLIDVYRRCKTREERRLELDKALNCGELVYLKELFGVNDLSGLEEKLCEGEENRHRRPLDFSDLGLYRDSSLQNDLNRIRAEIIWELDFSCLETVAKKHEGLISKVARIMYRTSATDEDTKDYANAGRYESRSSLGKYLDVVTENLRLIIESDLKKLASGDTGLAFILQDELPGKDIEGGIVFSNLYGYSAVELGQGISEPNGFEISPLCSATRGSQSMIVRIESGEIIEVLYNGIFKKGKNRLNHVVTTRDGVKHKITMPAEQLKEVTAVAKDIERKLGYSVDIEFGVTKKDGTIYIVQIRPITADQSEGKPLPQFRKEDVIAEFPLAINQCSARGVKVVFVGVRSFGSYLNNVQEKIGYAGMVVCGSSQIELTYPFLYGERLFWAGKSICKIGHDAINIRERAGKRNIVMGYFGDMKGLREKFSRMQEVLEGIFVSEEYFDIYSNGDRAVLVKAGAKPIEPGTRFAEGAPFVIAHRGLHTQEPENTIAAFKAAAQAGIPAIEMDVRLTKDGVPIMFHDDALDGKTTGKGRVEDLTWDEISDIRYKNDNSLGIPRLEDVVKEIPGATIFVIELKDALPDPSRIIEVMERLGVMSRTVFISSDLRLLKQVKAQNPDYRAGYILHDPTMQATPEAMGEFQKLADMLKAEKIDILSILVNVITPEHVRIIHAAGLHLNAAWDKLPDSEITRLKDLGVDSFALDEPVSAHRLLTNGQKAEQLDRRAISGGA